MAGCRHRRAPAELGRTDRRRSGFDGRRPRSPRSSAGGARRARVSAVAAPASRLPAGVAVRTEQRRVSRRRCAEVGRGQLLPEGSRQASTPHRRRARRAARAAHRNNGRAARGSQSAERPSQAPPRREALCRRPVVGVSRRVRRRWRADRAEGAAPRSRRRRRAAIRPVLAGVRGHRPRAARQRRAHFRSGCRGRSRLHRDGVPGRR